RRVGFSVRKDRRDYLASKPIVGSLVEHGPCVGSSGSARGSAGSVFVRCLAVAGRGRRFVRLEPRLGPLTMIDLRDLHASTRSLKSLTRTVRSQRAGMPAAT